MEKKSISIILQISLIGVFVFFALACASAYTGVQTKAQLDDLTGKPVSIALIHLGPPSYTSDDGQRGKIYTWNSEQSSTQTHIEAGTYTNAKTVSTENYCRKHLYVDAKGIIYYGKWEGNRCE